MPNDPASSVALVNGLYAIDAACPLADFAGAHAFAARRAAGGGEFVAVEVSPGLPPRARALDILLATPVTGVLNPVAHGPATVPGRKPAYYVVSSAPSGPSLGALRQWSESELLDDVLRPAAAALARLAGKGLTHRSIRPGNLFQAKAGEPVVLGPAWAQPPASAQPALYESPYVAMCHPAGRGEGTIADDIYALGVVLLVLALGRELMPGLDAAEVIQGKAGLGSFAALTRGQRLPPTLTDYLAVMLADDPSLRPPPSSFLEPGSRRPAARRATTWQRHATEPLALGGTEVIGTRGLAAAIVNAPDDALRSLRLGTVEQWIRRDLGEPLLARRIEEIVQLCTMEANAPRADAFLLMRAVALVDPLAPLTWQGTTFFPDGLGSVLATRDSEGVLAELIDAEALAAWASLRPEGKAEEGLRFEARQYRMLLRCRGWAGGLARLRYTLNPLLPCQSPLVSNRAPVTLAGLLAALEATANQPEKRAGAPIDQEIAGFILAHGAQALEAELSHFPISVEEPEYSLSTLKMFATLQTLARTGPLPGLGGWLAARSAPVVATWRQKSVRNALQERLAKLAVQGELNAMAALIEDPKGQARDAEGLRRAESAVRRIDAELQSIAEGSSHRAESARRMGQELAAGVGLAAVAGTLMLLAFG